MSLTGEEGHGVQRLTFFKFESFSLNGTEFNLGFVFSLIDFTLFYWNFLKSCF